MRFGALPSALPILQSLGTGMDETHRIWVDLGSRSSRYWNVIRENTNSPFNQYTFSSIGVINKNVKPPPKVRKIHVFFSISWFKHIPFQKMLNCFTKNASQKKDSGAGFGLMSCIAAETSSRKILIFVGRLTENHINHTQLLREMWSLTLMISWFQVTWQLPHKSY